MTSVLSFAHLFTWKEAGCHVVSSPVEAPEAKNCLQPIASGDPRLANSPGSLLGTKSPPALSSEVTRLSP